MACKVKSWLSHFIAQIPTCFGNSFVHECSGEGSVSLWLKHQLRLRFCGFRVIRGHFFLFFSITERFVYFVVFVFKSRLSNLLIRSFSRTICSLSSFWSSTVHNSFKSDKSLGLSAQNGSFSF